MASTTVADALAAKYHVSKSAILDRDADNMAVRMALGEAQIVSDTKSYLEEEGVNKAAFEGRLVGSTSENGVHTDLHSLAD